LKRANANQGGDSNDAGLIKICSFRFIEAKINIGWLTPFLQVTGETIMWGSTSYFPQWPGRSIMKDFMLTTGRIGGRRMKLTFKGHLKSLGLNRK